MEEGVVMCRIKIVGTLSLSFIIHDCLLPSLPCLASSQEYEMELETLKGQKKEYKLKMDEVERLQQEKKVRRII